MGAAPRTVAPIATGAISLLAIVVVLETGLTFFGPLIPQIQREFALSSSTVALALAVYNAIRLVFNLPTSRLVARSSLRVTMVWGAGILAGGALMMGLAPSFAVLLVGRMIMGVGAAMFILTTHFWIARLATPTSRARLFSYHQVAGIIGISLGPALGGVVAGWLSWRYAVGLSVITAVVTWIAAPRLPLPPQSAPPTRDGPATSGRVSIREVFGSGFCNLGFNFSFNGTIFTLVPLFAAQTLQLGPAAIGTLMMLGTLQRFVSALVGGAFATRFGTRPAVFVSLFGLSIAALSFVPVKTPLGLLGAISLLSWANLGGSFVIAMITDRTPEAQWGTMLGMNRTFGDVGAMIAPLLCGFLIDRYGFQAAFISISASILTAATVAYVLTSARAGTPAVVPDVDAAS
jgi:predicted MFS family arabinose efflux permease